MSLKDLIGKNVLDLILEFPKINWTYYHGGAGALGATIDSLTFVTYESHAPVSDKVDLFGPRLQISQGIKRKDLAFIGKDKERTIGLTDLVKLGKPKPTKRKYKYLPYMGEYYAGNAYGHIPMIDFDTEDRFDSMSDRQLLQMLRKQTAEVTQMRRGVFLKSSRSRNYHFFGVGYILSENDFTTFCGLCLSMKHTTPAGKIMNLVDERGVGHALTPMNLYMASEWDEFDTSPVENSHYAMGMRFYTLRVSPKPGQRTYPKIVDVMDYRRR